MLQLLGMSFFACSSDATRGAQITELDPRRVLQGQGISATISGRNFLTQVHVTLDSNSAPKENRVFSVWLGAYGLPADAVSYVNVTTLRILIPKTLPVGLYELKVQTPAGNWASMPAALTVLPPSTGIGGSSAIGSGGAYSTQSYSASSNTAPGSGGTSTNLPQGGVGGTLTALGGATGDTSTPVVGGTAGTFTNFGGVSTNGQGGSSETLSNLGGTTTSQTTTGGTAGTGATGPTMKVDGNLLRDTCGNSIILRGLQQQLSNQLPTGNDWAGLVDEIAATGANAARVQVTTAVLGVSGVDSVLARLSVHNLVAILNVDSISWLNDTSVRTMLDKYSRRLIIDAYWLGPNDSNNFLANAESAVAQIRGYGYQVPLLVLSNNYGYDLPTTLDSGLQILAADPLHNTLLEWAAFWGTNDYYQGLYGMSLTAGVAAAAAAPFPINIAVTQFAQTAPTVSIDYKSVITAAQVSGVSWLWSQWYDPNFVKDELTADGTYTGLDSLGTQVVVTNSGGLSSTTGFACGP